MSGFGERIPLRSRTKQCTTRLLVIVTIIFEIASVLVTMSCSSSNVGSDHSSDAEIPCKVEWLKNADGYLKYMVTVCSLWLQDGAQLAIPCEFKDKDILDHLVRDVQDHLEDSKALRVSIASLLQQDDSQLPMTIWHAIKTRCVIGEMQMESLDERCEACGVPFVDENP